jgi:hypothetical protein
MISINENKGFAITFPNGWTVSVQIGTMNYCANKEDWSETVDYNTSKPSPNAEIAAWKGDEWHDFDPIVSDKPEDWESELDLKSAKIGSGLRGRHGWVHPTEILKFMNLIASK